MKRILFICTGNTCRSSMAEAIARKVISSKKALDKISVSSAGIYAIPGEKASYDAVKVMSECGIDLTGHEANQISLKLIDEADLILTMTSAHKSHIVSMKPDAKGKVFTLIEYADGAGGSISDPFGQPESIYRECSNQLICYISKAIDKLIIDMDS